MISDTRERFIRSIAERLDPERIVEAHFFPSIRQGQVETGVAVIAATPVPAPAEVAAAHEDVRALHEDVRALHEDGDPPHEDVGAPDVEAGRRAPRAEVFTATFRWTRKGPERGKWLVEVVAEAHAPIPTVGAVVRGVQERAGEALDAHRMTGDEVRAVLPAADAAPVPGAGA